VDVSATAGGRSGKTTAKVVLHVVENPAGAGGATQASLKAASGADATVVWEYPYDGTVFPRGIGAPTLMWDQGTDSDIYYIHITSDTYELEAYTASIPPRRFNFGQTVWDQLLNSSSGPLELKVARFDGSKATVVIDHHDVVAPGSMRGTIYYWAIN